MSGDRQPRSGDATAAADDSGADRERDGESLAWSTLSEESVPLHDEAGRAEAREREARLRLVLGRRHR